MKQTFISLSNPIQWKAALQGVPHAFAHTWENCHAMHLSSGYPTQLYVCEDNGVRVVCPIAEREFRGKKDLVTPYGFSGFTGNGVLPNLQQHWKSFAQDKGYVCGYIGLNPLLENETLLASEDVYSSNSLYILNLRPSITELYENLTRSRKQQLKNFDALQAHITTDKKLLADFFLNTYHDFFAKKGASPVYNFSKETLSYLVQQDNVLLTGTGNNGKIEAVSVFAYTPYAAEYLFNVSVPEGQGHTTALLWYAVHQLKKLQIPWLNLGGGVQEGDSIAQYKKRFSAQEFRLKALKQVYNQTAYEALCREAGVDPHDRTGYFPAYRKP